MTDTATAAALPVEDGPATEISEPPHRPASALEAALNEPREEATPSTEQPEQPERPEPAQRPQNRVAAPPLAPSLHNIPVDTRFVLGHAKMNVGDLMNLAKDRIVPIDRGLAEPLDMEVNGTLIARVELMEGQDGRLSVRVLELVGSPDTADGRVHGG